MARAGSRMRTMRSGTIGSVTRDSTHTATARSTIAPPTMAAVGQEIQSKELPTKVIQMSRRLTPAAISVAPA